MVNSEWIRKKYGKIREKDSGFMVNSRKHSGKDRELAEKIVNSQIFLKAAKNMKKCARYMR